LRSHFEAEEKEWKGEGREGKESKERDGKNTPKFLVTVLHAMLTSEYIISISSIKISLALTKSMKQTGCR